MSTEKKDSTKVVTGEVRFSYVHVWEKGAPMNAGDEGKYGAVLLIDKKDTKTVNAIQAAIEAAKVAKWGTKIPKVLKSVFRDGDEEKDDENYVGKYFMSCNSKEKPGIFDKDRNPIMDKEEFYSGVYGHASINFFGYDQKGAGVGCGLNAVMKSKDGERLSGADRSADAFGDIDTDNDL